MYTHIKGCYKATPPKPCNSAPHPFSEATNTSTTPSPSMYTYCYKPTPLKPSPHPFNEATN